jgi:hypothetical protein
MKMLFFAAGVLVVVAIALALMNRSVNKVLRSMIDDISGDLQEVLAAYERTDDELMELGTTNLKILRSKADRLLTRGDEIYTDTKRRVRSFVLRLERLITE